MNNPTLLETLDRIEAWIEQIQAGDRPLPWVVHSGSSYRRIASQPTRENPRSFSDGNVLHAYKQRSDGHPDLSMDEDQLGALVNIVNTFPQIAAQVRAMAEEREELRLALKPFADCLEYIADEESDEEWAKFRLLVKHYRAAGDAILSRTASGERG